MERLIIVEGPQGVGKTTLANYLRDNIAGSNLYRLSGQKDKTLTGLEYSRIMYDALIDYLEKMQSVPMDMIFDRTFMTEEVYARLGYKDYSFTKEYNYYLSKLSSLKYEMYYFSLYLEDVDLFRKRLDREEHHLYQEFSLQNSINQQNMYLELAMEISKKEINYDNPIQVVPLAMDDFDKSYTKVKKILKMEV